MGYRNAQDIFPEGLLRQIQRYVAGETIYIPAGDERKAWVIIWITEKEELDDFMEKYGDYVKDCRVIRR